MTPSREILADGVEIWHGDCRDVLPLIGKVDAVVTDPPYGINHSSGHGASWKNTVIAGDNDTSLRDEVLQGFETVAAFGTWKTPPIVDTRGCLIFDKGPAFGMGDLSFPWKPSFELIYIRGACGKVHGMRALLGVMCKSVGKLNSRALASERRAVILIKNLFR